MAKDFKIILRLMALAVILSFTVICIPMCVNQNNQTSEIEEVRVGSDKLWSDLVIPQDLRLAIESNKNAPTFKVYGKNVSKSAFEKKLSEVKVADFIIEDEYGINDGQRIVNLINYYSYINGVDHKIIFAMMAIESQFCWWANSFLGPGNGRGLLQVSEVALKDFNDKNSANKKYGPQDLYDIEINIEVGCWVYKQNERYADTVCTLELVAAYNCGAGTVRSEVEYLLEGRRKNGEEYIHLSKFYAVLDRLS